MYENYNIESFMQAWFKKDYTNMKLEDFKIVYAEYLDASGLFLTEDFERRTYIYHLSSRINYIKILILLQRDFIDNFDKPFERDFGEIKEKYGYILKWKGDKDDFEKQLNLIERRELKFQSTLESKIKELQDSRNANKKKTDPELDDEWELNKSRVSFIKMLNSLCKIGYNLDKKNTSVEELALMIKQQMDEVEEHNRRISQNAR